MTSHFLSLDAVISVIPNAVIRTIVASFPASAATVRAQTEVLPRAILCEACITSSLLVD